MAGFGAGSDIRGPVPPDLGGPVRSARTGQWEFPRGLPVPDPWATLCDQGGGCGGRTPQPGLTGETGEFTDDGDVGMAIGRAAELPKTVVRGWAPLMALQAEQCFSQSSSLRLDLASGNLMTQVRPPAGNDFDPVPVLTYNAQLFETSEFGYGVRCGYKRSLTPMGPGNQRVNAGDGTAWSYTNWNGSTGYYVPPAGAQNTLRTPPFSETNWIETQPDGTELKYTGAGLLSFVQNPGGSRWTMTYDGSNKPTRITDSLGSLTTLAYDGSNKLKRLVDPAGRITSFTVNGSGDLTQTTSPELCVTELRYDGSHKIKARIESDGSRTSFSYDFMNRVNVVTVPDGTRRTITYGTPGMTAVRAITEPDGTRTTLAYSSDLLRSVDVPGGGRTSYTWDSGQMKRVVNPLGEITTFAYLTETNSNVKRLKRIESAIGGIFTYSYGSPPKRVIDEGGHITTLVWKTGKGVGSIFVDLGNGRNALHMTGRGSGVFC